MRPRARHGGANGGTEPRSDRLPGLIEEARQLTARGAPRDALSKLEEALAICRGQGNRASEGIVLSDLGEVYRVLGNPHEALNHFTAALLIFREVGFVAAEGVTLSRLGAVYRRLGQPENALEQYERAIAIARDQVDRNGEGMTLYNLGLLYHGLARPDEALEHFEGALTCFREVGDRRLEGAVLGNAGEVYRGLGRWQEALENFREALRIAREVEDRRGEAATLNNLGAVYDGVGQRHEALEHLERALAIWREVGDRVGEGATLNTLGATHLGLGRAQVGLERLEEALHIRRETGDRAGECATLNNLGAAYRDLGRPREALESLEQALVIARQVSDRRSEAATLDTLGALNRDLARPQEALGFLIQALDIARDVGDRAAQGTTLYNLGAVYADLGRSHEALEHYGQAVEIAELVRRELRSEGLQESYRETLGDLYASYASLSVEEGKAEHAVQAAERSRAHAFLELVGESPAEVTEGVDAELRVEERRLLRELGVVHERLIEERSRAGDERDVELMAELERKAHELELSHEQNQAEIRRKNPRYAALTQPIAWELEKIQAEAGLLDEETTLLQYVLASRGSLAFCVLRETFEAFSLPAKEEIEAMVRELRAAVVHGLHRYPNGHELYKALIEPAADLIAGKKLLISADGPLHYLPFTLLLSEEPHGTKPAAAPDGGEQAASIRTRGGLANEDKRKLLEKLEADMASLPAFDWQRLPYLIRNHQVAYAPPASIAGLVRDAARSREQHVYTGEFAGLAAPLTEGILPAAHHGLAGMPVELGAALAHTGEALAPIPKTVDEVWGVAELFSEGELAMERPTAYDDRRVALRTGEDATKEEALRITSGEQTFRFLHIASHGLLDPEKPQFSGLVLTASGRRDPFWRMFEIFDARIPSDLVVLSACETGLGKVVSGEGIVGLTSAFMYAGAASVCVSLWKVAEESSPPLMRSFYEALLAGESKASALRHAQLQMLEGSYVHPFWWAPFVLIGE